MISSYGTSKSFMKFLSYPLPLLRGGLGWGKNFTTHLDALYRNIFKDRIPRYPTSLTSRASNRRVFYV
jgi:hypothetical protein